MKTQPNNKQEIDPLKKEIENALSGEEIEFEEIPDEKASPLNQPVVDKSLEKTAPAPSVQQEPVSGENAQQEGNETNASDEDSETISNSFDAPEQEIYEQDMTGNSSDVGSGIEIPLSHAAMAADTFLGIADNALEVGGGFFITIRKHQDFYDFEEVVQVIEEQNSRNVKRMKLDADDKALLRPLLIVIIRKKAKVLTPEQQLAAAVLSILVKKAKVAVEIRAENEILVERIRDIIREETSQQSPPDNQAPTDHKNNSSDINLPNGPLSSVMEVAE